MKTLNEDIKTGNFKPVYLLYGEEAYLKKQYRDRITKAIFPDGDTVNYAYYEGKGINPGELIDLAETMPFFADRRLIVIENSGFFKNASPELADYIKTMPDTACFLFVENEADKRGKMYKAVKSKGRVVEMARQDEKTLLYWVAGNVKKEGYKIKEQTARYLLSTTGTDMENLEKELEKLFCYCMGKEEIEVRDIEAICTTQITNKIFEMVEAVAVRNQKKALDYYYDLLALKEPPMRILYLLTRQFKLLLEVKDLAGKRYDKAAIAKTVGLHPFVAGKYMQQCRTFEKKELKSNTVPLKGFDELAKGLPPHWLPWWECPPAPLEPESPACAPPMSKGSVHENGFAPNGFPWKGLPPVLVYVVLFPFSSHVVQTNDSVNGHPSNGLPWVF